MINLFSQWKPIHSALLVVASVRHLLAAEVSAQRSLRANSTRARPRLFERLFSHRGASPTANPSQSELLSPQANDTLSEAYWADVNREIYLAGLTTPTPKTLNDPLPTLPPEPYRQVGHASLPGYRNLDTPQALEDFESYDRVTPKPPLADPTVSNIHADDWRRLNVVPYDMRLGAGVMYGLSPKNTETPPPTQEYVDEAFVAHCPMIMFENQLRLTAPHCGSTVGDWSDPETDRPVLRWKDNSHGGLQLGVDSVISGNGSVLYATVEEKMTIKGYQFSLRNCQGRTRFTIEEQIYKVNHMGEGARSTWLDHDTGKTKEAYFYKYIIRHPNGTDVAATVLFRKDQSQVNFTLHENNSAPTSTNGITYAVAQRQGIWTGDKWRQCSGSRRSWILDFLLANSEFETLATVSDLRVAAAAVITLMAVRDESTGTDGFQHLGEGHTYWILFRTFFVLCGITIAMCWCWMTFEHKGYDEKCKRVCFRLETILLPKRPVKERQGILHATY